MEIENQKIKMMGTPDRNKGGVPTKVFFGFKKCRIYGAFGAVLKKKRDDHCWKRKHFCPVFGASIDNQIV